MTYENIPQLANFRTYKRLAQWVCNRTVQGIVALVEIHAYILKVIAYLETPNGCSQLGAAVCEVAS